MSDIKKIVVFLPERLGDAIFCTPAIKLLKKHYKTAHIEAITFSQLTATMLAHNPSITTIHAVPDKNAIQTITADSDLTINLHSEKIIHDFLACIPINFIPSPPQLANQHLCEHSLEFVRSLTKCEVMDEDKKYAIYPQTEHFNSVKNLLIKQGVRFDQDILIGCHLGCHGLAKRGWRPWKRFQHDKVWPLKNFLILERLLKQHHPHIRFVLTGSKNEDVLAKKFIKRSPTAINLINQTSVLELAALMSYLKVFITPDTGALHTACATNVDIVALFRPQYLSKTGPYPMQSNYTIVQSIEMTDITPESVYEAVLSSPAMASIT